MPSVVVTTTAFLPLAEEVASSLGFPDARIAVVEHPLGGISEADVAARAERLVDALVSLSAG